MTDTRACVCGVPSEANYHTEVIIGREGWTTDLQQYTCAEHAQTFGEGDVVCPFGSTQWVVIESTTTHLRGAE